MKFRSPEQLEDAFQAARARERERIREARKVAELQAAAKLEAAATAIPTADSVHCDGCDGYDCDGLPDAATTVLAFMEIGHPDRIAHNPTIPQPNVRALCSQLIVEEIAETGAAIQEENIVEIADGIADSIFVLLFTAHCYGIPFNEIWDEVARTNMAKFPGGKAIRDQSTGKILKPPGWTPPDIAGVLARHIPQLKMYCPNCGKQHLDEGIWATKPHMTHRCVDDATDRGCTREWVVLPYAFGVDL
jgi:hypothetical protein